MIWKQHPILTNYEVSDTGEVRRGTHVLKSHIKGGRYRVIRLRHNGATVTKYVHRLVLETFVGVEDDLVCLHLDNDCINNNLSNLQWGTYKDNMRQCLSEGRHRFIIHPKVTDVQAAYIKASKLPYKILAAIFQVHLNTIKRIRNGHTTRFRTREA